MKNERQRKRERETNFFFPYGKMVISLFASLTNSFTESSLGSSGIMNSLSARVELQSVALYALKSVLRHELLIRFSRRDFSRDV